MATEQQKAAVEAVTKKTETVTVGAIVSFGVKTPAGARPTFTPSGQDRPIYCEKTGPETWVASWAVTAPGEHTITVSVPDTAPAVFTVNATEKD